VALLAGLALQSAALAQQTKKLAKAEIITELRSAHKLLAEADRDYYGHRLKAAEAVHKAIAELEGTHHKRTVPLVQPAVVKRAAPVGEAAIHEAQARSDAQLRHAMEILQRVLPTMNTHHPKSATKVSGAIAEIKTALAIK
jgi:hypothetical protein